MIEDRFERFFKAEPEKVEKIWKNLNLRETFVDGQIFPYRVEFDSPEQKGAFASGELNIHHGPLLSVHGAIGEVNDSFRGLNYFFGSYVISFRWIRPVRLEFYREDNGIRLVLISYLKPWIKPVWRFGNSVFWRFFGITFLF